MTPAERKQRPIASGVLAYFPDAMMELAHCSFVGNEQHNPGQPLHWAREKSTDHPDACARHLTERMAGKVFDDDGVRLWAKVIWRAAAALQLEIEAERTTNATKPQPNEVYELPAGMKPVSLMVECVNPEEPVLEMGHVYRVIGESATLYRVLTPSCPTGVDWFKLRFKVVP